jgi:hypothetical protein
MVGQSGAIALARARGLSISVGTIPAYIGRSVGLPTDFFHLGHVNLGHAFGWGPDIRISKNSQMIYPIDPEWTLLGWSVISGLTMTADEIVVPPVLPSSLMPWDRNPVPVTLRGANGFAGGAGGNLFVYTVPVNKKLWIATGDLMLTRTNTATAVTSTSLTFQRTWVEVLTVLDFANVQFQPLRASLSPDGLVLSAGEQFMATYASGDTGGFHSAVADTTAYLFDA